MHVSIGGYQKLSKLTLAVNKQWIINKIDLVFVEGARFWSTNIK